MTAGQLLGLVPAPIEQRFSGNRAQGALGVKLLSSYSMYMHGLEPVSMSLQFLFIHSCIWFTHLHLLHGGLLSSYILASGSYLQPCIWLRRSCIKFIHSCIWSMHALLNSNPRHGLHNSCLLNATCFNLKQPAFRIWNPYLAYLANACTTSQCKIVSSNLYMAIGQCILHLADISCT